MPLRSVFAAGEPEFNYFELPSEVSDKSSMQLSTRRACLSSDSKEGREDDWPAPAVEPRLFGVEELHANPERRC